ncbi:MAG: DUF5683 domain-containing protein [Flavobacteriaceae bacterium]|nr:DUF5683 domain-containing protein [Flavobacteriaceae bacterium]MCY4217345.1 DUF5683 domain-containing protein [Flavobacteriaceae bacterium]MCY4254409.1 DUF5683 domain-containing protein [Flavobacteriaceae bacterium]
MKNRYLLPILCSILVWSIQSQVPSTDTTQEPTPVKDFQVKDTLMSFEAIDWREQFSERRLRLMADPRTPAKATFLSTVLPGLGQLYLGKYLWAPIFWGGIGASIYFFVDNSKEYNRFRDIYKRRLMGYTDDEYSALIPDNDQILRGMDFYENYRDISAIFIAVSYVLNVIHANVAAHLLQFNVDEKLSIRSNLLVDPQQTGLSISLEF